jgi:septal ring factor EnvC (AmiA/AmiB activator)
MARGEAKNRRRNKRAKGVRRLSGQLDTLRAELGASRGRVEFIEGRLRAARADNSTLEDSVAYLSDRIAKLERVPRWVRWLFRAV